MFPYNLATSFDFGFRELIGSLVIYVYLAYTMMLLADRLHEKDGWMAWVPIANLYLLSKMAKREWWWLLGLLVPYLNIFVMGFLWSEVSQRLGKNAWIGAAIIVPFIGLFVPGYLVVSTPSGAGHHHGNHPTP
jgi:hypothetical protein